MSPLVLAAGHSLTTSEPSIGASLGKMVFGLAVVVVSILVITKVLKFLKGDVSSPRRQRSSTLEVISRQSLGKGLQLAVVRFGGREVLVGIAGQQISFHEPNGGSLEDELTLFDEELPAAVLAPQGAPAAARLAELRRGLAAATHQLPASHSLAAISGGSFLDRLREATTRR